MFLVLKFSITSKFTEAIFKAIKTSVDKSLFNIKHLVNFLANFKLINALNQAHQKAFMIV
jgi:hypothetical protein